jgi:hypothetical protein
MLGLLASIACALSAAPQRASVAYGDGAALSIAVPSGWRMRDSSSPEMKSVTLSRNARESVILSQAWPPLTNREDPKLALEFVLASLASNAPAAGKCRVGKPMDFESKDGLEGREATVACARRSISVIAFKADGRLYQVTGSGVGLLRLEALLKGARHSGGSGKTFTAETPSSWTRLAVALPGGEAGAIELGVPNGFVESYKAGDSVLSGSGGRVIKFHQSQTRGEVRAELEQDLDVYADAIKAMAESAGDRCMKEPAAWSELPNEWTAAHAVLQCEKGTRVAMLSAGPGFTLQAFGAGVTPEKLLGLLATATLTKSASELHAWGAPPKAWDAN